MPIKKRKAITKLIRKREAANDAVPVELVLEKPEDYERTLSDKEHLEIRKRERREK